MDKRWFSVLYVLGRQVQEAVVLAPDKTTAWLLVLRRHFTTPILTVILPLEDRAQFGKVA